MGGHVRVGVARRRRSRSRSRAAAPRRRRRSGRTSRDGAPLAELRPDGVQFALLRQALAETGHRLEARFAESRGRDRRSAPIARRWPKPGPEPRHVGAVARRRRAAARRSPPASGRAPPCAGRPTTSTPSGIALPSVTSAPAPTSTPRPITAPFSTVAPMPTRLPSPMRAAVQDRHVADGAVRRRWSAESRCRCGRRSRPARSSPRPTTIGSLSPRSTALNQTEAPGSQHHPARSAARRAPPRSRRPPAAPAPRRRAHRGSFQPLLEFAVQPPRPAASAPAGGRGAAARRAMIARSSSSHCGRFSLTST